MVLNITIFFFFLLLKVVSLIINVNVSLPVCFMSSNVLIMSSECERLQTRRPRQFFGVGLMVFSQPLTGKTSFVHLFNFSRQCSFFFLIFQCFSNKNKRK